MTVLHEINHILEQMPPYGGYVTLPRKFLIQVKAALSDVPVVLHVDNPDSAIYNLEYHLTKTEYLLMRALVAASGRALSPGSLIAAGNLSSPGGLWVHIKRLRQKLEKHAPQMHLETIRGRGYLLIVESENKNECD